MKKKIVISLVFIILMVTFSSIVGAETVIKYGLWDKNQVPAMQKIIDNFETEYPDISVKIELTPYSQYWTKLQISATGGSLPDVFWLNGPNFALYASNGMIMPIDEKIKNSDKISESSYIESLVNLYTYEDKLYGLPKDFDTIGLYYNKEIFDKYNVEYPKKDWNWNDLINAAKKITNQSEGVWGIAAPQDGQENYYNTIFQSGGYIVKNENGKKISGYDKQDTIDGLKFWVDLIHKYKISPTLAQMTDTSALDLFSSGKVAMLYHGSWQQIAFSNNEYTKDKVDVAVLPKGDRKGVVIHGLANVISSQSENPEAAWRFLEYLGSEESAKIMANTGTVIPAYKNTQQAWLDSNPNMNLEAFIEMLPHSYPYPQSVNTAKWNELENKYFNKAWSGEISVKEAADKVAEEMNKILREE
ncbi:ABC transporter substrate-binding protein [Halanaerobium praevalens]|uniref:Carbohydrate ABC transporter substrate-binding protein, CUT1 family n=1 Tax=Halanaerobium praevalens (strain ATCC 33744 / DSM 2228 / GSL) TaxID=572479 RepID=E3DNI7_HALPG|nr:sugar ABC transporter substrate-binding protein [Halanaerobium praevalens]ADO76525.1 carbohydrate ABC transporter substrate-binding protein, CUT1 family [Halanaerobium praevalens DSM 2228]